MITKGNLTTLAIVVTGVVAAGLLINAFPETSFFQKARSGLGGA